MYLILRRQGTETNTTGWTVCYRTESEADARDIRKRYYPTPEYILVKIVL